MAKFIKSADCVNAIALDDRITEFCFIGRSNVGKSTLINALANQSIARTSKQPGRTQLINVFDFGEYRIVDLPGYGFAQVSKDKKYQINQMVIDYISNRANLFCIFLICDIQHISEMDIDVYRNVCKRFANVYVVLNKTDKVNKSFFDNNKIKISKLFDCSTNNLIPASAIKKLNISYIKRLMNTLTKKLK
ncbi:MAG: ribosome biogenesis GTP-binding protein YihA/YsxC [Mycoplasmoidaceae bacterium]|nr:ribosome biogenesis GTP-binding protein YihA/YsxC [Mycoplasmoidaceae bacterium]